MNLETERLIIRNFRESDFADFVEYRSDPEVCKFQGYEPFTEEMGRGYIESLIDGTFGETGKWNQIGVELKSEKLIGDIGLKPESYDARVVEFGVSFSRKYQGKGLAGEALTKVFDHLFRGEKHSPHHRHYGCQKRENDRFDRKFEISPGSRIKRKFLGRGGKSVA